MSKVQSKTSKVNNNHLQEGARALPCWESKAKTYE